MTSLSLRIWCASIALLTVAIATLFMIAFAIMRPDLKTDMPGLAIFVCVWTVSIPNIVKLRKMIAEQKRGMK